MWRSCIFRLDPSTITNTDSFCYSSGEYPSPNPGYLRNSCGAPTKDQPMIVGDQVSPRCWDQLTPDQSSAPHNQSQTRSPVGIHTNTPVGYGSRDLPLVRNQMDRGIVYLGEVQPMHFRGQRHLGRRRRRISARNHLPHSLGDVHSSSSVGGRAQSANGEARTPSGSSLSIGPSWSSRRRRRRPRHVTFPSQEKIAFPVEL